MLTILPLMLLALAASTTNVFFPPSHFGSLSASLELAFFFASLFEYECFSFCLAPYCVAPHCLLCSFLHIPQFINGCSISWQSFYVPNYIAQVYGLVSIRVCFCTSDIMNSCKDYIFPSVVLNIFFYYLMQLSFYDFYFTFYIPFGSLFTEQWFYNLLPPFCSHVCIFTFLFF